jgi:hypothetical protein
LGPPLDACAKYLDSVTPLRHSCRTRATVGLCFGPFAIRTPTVQQLYEGLIAIKHGSTAQHPAEKCNPAQLPPLHTIGSCAAHPACEQICLADQASMSPDICMDRPFARVALPAVALLRRYLRWVTPLWCTHGPRTRASRDALLVHRVATSHIPCDAWRTSSLSRTDIAV